MLGARTMRRGDRRRERRFRAAGAAGWAAALALAPALAGAAAAPGASVVDGLWSSPLRFRRIGPEQGLRHAVVYAVAQDREGFVWFATEDGLDRWDGARFVHFVHDPYDPASIASPDTSYVFESRDGTLWVGTWGGGLDRFDRARGGFEHFRHDPRDPASLSDDRVQRIFEDAAGRLWIATFRGLNLWRPEPDARGGFRRFLHDPARPASLAHDRVWGIAEAGGGALWLATDAGLDRFDPASGSAEHWPLAPAPAGLSSARLRALARDGDGALWLGSEAGLERLDPERGEIERFRPDPRAPRSLPHPIVNALLVDRRGQLWVGTAGGGLALFDRATRTFAQFRSDPGDAWTLGHEDVRSLHEDRNGLLWISTRGGGASLLDPSPPKFRHLALRSSDPNRRAAGNVQAVARDADGTLWVGTLTGLTRFAPDGSATWFRPAPGVPGSLGGERVQALLVDRAGTLWVGSYEGGLDRFDRARSRFVHHRHDPDDPESLSDSRVQALLEDRAGRFWVGTRYGLNLFERASGAARRFRHDPADPVSLCDDFVWTLAEGEDGSIWVGTDVGGLCRLDPASGRFERFRHRPGEPDSLANDRVRALHETPDGALWVGTRHGLDRFDPRTRTFRHFLEAHGLPNATIQAILPDRSARLWIATNAGLARLVPATGAVQVFGLAHGLRQSAFTGGAAFAAPDGELFFGGPDGLSRFVPEQIEVGRAEAPLVLTRLTVLGRERRFARGGAPLVLGPRENVVGFEFAALDFANPGAHRYGYRMAGLDRDWIDAGGRREALYAGLPPGEYAFEVRVALDGAHHQRATLAVPLRVLPPWWQTLWFRAGAAAVALGALALYHLRRVRRLRRERERLERLVAERTAEVRRQRDRLEEIDRMVQAINAEVDFGALLRSVVENVSALEGADRALALVADRASGGFALAAAAGAADAEAKLAPFALDELLAGHLAGAREVVPGVLRGAAGDSRLGAAGFGADAKAALSFRIESAGEPIGFLLFGSARAGAFDALGGDELAGLREHLTWTLAKGRMIQELRDLNAKKNLFLGIAAHDLRSPLSAIHSYAELLRSRLADGKLDPRHADRFLGHIRRATDQMLGLIRDLLDVAAIESGRLDLRLGATPMVDLFEERRAIHAAMAERKGIDLLIESPPAGLAAVMDREKIGEVLDNLMANAIKYTPPGGHVRIWCEAEEREVVTHVRDTGVGLDPEELPRVFEGGRLSARPTGGESSHGLGLLIVRKLVDLHGGRAWVESEKGRGTTFSFSLARAA
jgi:ligand-binding sensor domain-containing protein/signal transduction histidine kinase